MDWQFLLGSGGLLGLGYLIFKFGRFTQKFDTFVISTTARFDSLEVDLKEIKKNIHSIDVRLSILESETIMYNMIPDNNARSNAAKESWKRRKQKQLANIGAE